MADLFKREIAVNQLLMARFCSHSVLASKEARLRAREARSVEHFKSSALGDAVHKFMDGAGVDRVDDALCAEAPNLSMAEREELLVKARNIAQKKLAWLVPGESVRIEQLVSWLDKETGWKIYSQPDRVEVLTDEEGEYVQVLDWKLGGRIQRRHKEAARLFGLIEFMLRGGRMRIKMAVESLQDDATSWSEWLVSPHDALHMLRDVQDIVTRLSATMKLDQPVKRVPGSHCYGCKVRLACRQGEKWVARDKESRPAAAHKPRRYDPVGSQVAVQIAA